MTLPHLTGLSWRDRARGSQIGPAIRDAIMRQGVAEAFCRLAGIRPEEYARPGPPRAGQAIPTGRYGG